MDNFVDFLVNRVAMNITKVRSLAASSGGQCTWRFSQAKDPVRSLIGNSSKTKKGICEIVAAKWVCERANGRSLETWLNVGGVTGKRDKLDKSKLALLAMTFGTGAPGNDADRQRENTKNWMRTQGVNEKTGRAWTEDNGYTGGCAEGILDALEEHRGPFRALLSVWGSTFLGSSGHIMAVDVGAPNVLYFDPNFGEFQFPTFAGFKSWFTTYYATSRCGWALNNSYKVQYY